MISRRVRAVPFLCVVGAGLGAVAWAQSAQRTEAMKLAQRAAIENSKGSKRDLNEVIRLSQLATKTDPSYPRAYTWLGAAYQDKFDRTHLISDRQNACGAFTRAVRLAPGSPDATRAIRGLNELGCPVPKVSAPPAPAPNGGAGNGNFGGNSGSSGAGPSTLSATLVQRWNAPAGVTGLAFSSDGQTLTGAGLDGSWFLWQSATGAPLQQYRGGGGDSGAVAASPRYYAAGAGTLRGSIRLFDARDGQPVRGRDAEPLQGSYGDVTGLAYSRDGRTLAAAGADRSLKVFDARQNTLLFRAQDPRLDVLGVAFSPDGRMIAASFGGEARIYSSEKGSLIRVLKADDLPMRALAWSRDGNSLAGASGYVIRVWNPNTGQLRRILTGHRLAVNALAFGNGPVLASGGADAQVRLWNAASGAALASLKLHSYGVRGVAFDATGKRLATGDESGQIGVWRLP